MAEGHNPKEDLQSRIIQRAAQDPSFRQALISNPRQAIQQEAGVEIPASVQIEVVEQTPNKIILTLPAAQGQARGELSDQELGAVAAGGTWATSCHRSDLTCWGPTCNTSTYQDSACPCH